VIEGFLDILLPSKEPQGKKESAKPPSVTPNSLYEFEDASASSVFDSTISSASTTSKRPSHVASEFNREVPKGRKPLFIIKPGGIAGYLGKCTSLQAIIARSPGNSVFDQYCVIR